MDQSLHIINVMNVRYLLHKVLTITFGTFLFSCSNNIQEVNMDEAATFLVSEITANSELISHPQVPAIKEASFINYKACLKDAAVQAALVGEQFKVEINNESKLLTTDGDGCLAWSNAIVFPWMKNETWMKDELHITATQNHLGKRTVQIYVNPWLSGSSAVMDGRYKKPAIESISRESLVSGIDGLGSSDSKLRLTRLDWEVVRKRGRASTTVIDWKLKATPVLERLNIDGQIKRETLESGSAEIKLTLKRQKFDSSLSNFSTELIKSISWQGGEIKLQGEFVIETELLPALGDQSYLSIDFALPGSLPNTKGSLALDGIENEIAPELVDMSDIQVQGDITQSSEVLDILGELNISSLKLVNESDRQDGYLLDQNLNLSITKTYRLEFSPKAVLPGETVMGTLPRALTQGSLNLEVYLYSPKVSEANFDEPDLSQFSLISKTSKQVSIRPDGLVTSSISLPMAVSTTPLLRLKNLLVIKATPSGSIENIRESIVSASVYPLAETNSVTASLQSSSQIYSSLERDSSQSTLGLQKRTALSLDLYEKHLKFLAQAQGDTLQRKSLAQLSQERVSAKLVQLTNGSAANFSLSDLRTLMSTRAKPKQTLAKLCQQFYELPSTSREFNWGSFDDVLEGGEEWKACVENPKAFLNVSPSTHLIELLQKESLNDIAVTRPKFISQARGDIFRGVGYFASFGDRTSEGSGERTGRTIESNMGFQLSIPFISKAGIGDYHSYATYQAKEKAQMQASFERQYTQQKDIELEYNRITLEFLAKIKRCLHVANAQEKKSLLVCEDDDRLSRVQENWYFIGDTRLNKIGVITNANMDSDIEMAQIIRGEAAFKNIWGEFREEDRALVLERLDGDRQGILQTPITEQLKIGQIPVGVGFPGLITPY
ncbi:MAG: hypothetical protein CME71_01560 [Halobacteriovorax sp.]|nr:hypothetical protein [Halobacteriovorax sp.]